MLANASGTKRCAECRLEKSIGEFTIDRQRKDGRYVYCRGCHNSRARGEYKPRTATCGACAGEWQPRRRGKTRLCPTCIETLHWCRICHLAKPHAEFHAATAARTRLCRACISEQALRLKYGLSRAEYDAMLARQGGGCAICHKTPEGNGRALSVDHDHSCCSGVNSCGACVRGLLCTQCNYGLGQFSDDQSRLLEAVRYLKKAG